MDIKEERFIFSYSSETRIRHRHKRIKNRIIQFVIQLEILIGNKWYPIVRYDTSHGFAHLDILHANGTVDKVPLPVQDYNEALILAEQELQATWEIQKERYSKEVRQNERK